MSRIIILRPGKDPETSPCRRPLQLADLHKVIGVDTLDARGLGTIPPAGTRVHMWIDDLGLHNQGALPNRRLPNGQEVCGVIVLCGIEGDEDVGFNDAEIRFMLRDIELRWDKLDPRGAKPAPVAPRFISLGVRR